MAVQFNCSSCGKPIEIDDEFAGQSVTCPYCRTVVRAVAGGSAPMAAPMGGAMSAGIPPQIGAMPFAPAVKPNWFASGGLVCAFLVLICFCMILGVLGSQLQTRFPDGKASPTQMQEATQELVKRPLVVTVSWVVMLSAIAGTVLSILGLVKREGRRWQAIIGVTICGLFVTCMGLIIVSSLAGMAAGKSP